MEQSAVQVPSKKMRVYGVCKNAVAVLITAVALLPIVYLLGSDDALYPCRPLFAAYDEEPYFQAKLADALAALNTTLVANLHLDSPAGEPTRDWHHLQEFARYLGFQLNAQQISTVSRLIVPEPRPKKAKATPADARLVEQAYAFANSGELNALRNKLNRIAVGTIGRLKMKPRETKNGEIGEVLRNRIIQEVTAPRVWIITIHPDNWQHHSPEELRKQITALSKERINDRFVLVSSGQVDPDWKKVKAIPFSIADGVLGNLRNRLKQAAKAALPFEVNTTRVVESVLCHHESSLFHLNNFLHTCNATFACRNAIQLLRKPKKALSSEDSTTIDLLNELCEVGHIDAENAEFKAALEKLGFYGEHEKAEDSLKLYLRIATGRKCQGAKQCSYSWLNPESKPAKPQKEPEAAEPTKQPSKPTSKPKQETPLELKDSPKPKEEEKPVNEKKELKKQKEVSLKKDTKGPKDVKEKKEVKDKQEAKESKPLPKPEEPKFKQKENKSTIVKQGKKEKRTEKNSVTKDKPKKSKELKPAAPKNETTPEETLKDGQGDTAISQPPAQDQPLPTDLPKHEQPPPSSLADAPADEHVHESHENNQQTQPIPAEGKTQQEETAKVEEVQQTKEEVEVVEAVEAVEAQEEKTEVVEEEEKEEKTEGEGEVEAIVEQDGAAQSREESVIETQQAGNIDSQPPAEPEEKAEIVRESTEEEAREQEQASATADAEEPKQQPADTQTDTPSPQPEEEAEQQQVQEQPTPALPEPDVSQPEAEVA